MKKYILGAGMLFAVGAGCTPGTAVTSFQECVEAGNPVIETYPRQCVANGETFVEDVGNAAEKQDIIRVSEPDPNDAISSPVAITGEARGGWYFEGSFPVRLIGENGGLLARGVAQADGEWMTEDFVPFTAALDFTAAPQNATLILSKDNPSGLPENDDELRVPVVIE